MKKLMAQAKYQYGTSPRKIEPDYTRKTKQRPKRKALKVVEDLPRQQIKISSEQRKRQLKMTVTVVGLFLSTVSCYITSAHRHQPPNSSLRSRRGITWLLCPSTLYMSSQVGLFT